MIFGCLFLLPALVAIPTSGTIMAALVALEGLFMPLSYWLPSSRVFPNLGRFAYAPTEWARLVGVTLERRWVSAWG